MADFSICSPKERIAADIAEPTVHVTVRGKMRYVPTALIFPQH